MKGAVHQEPAYVLHRRPWQESSLLVDILSLNHGRLSVIARGANKPRSPLKAQLQPFQPLLLDWQGRSDLKTLTQTDVRPAPAPRHTRALYSGLYINELLQRVLPPSDPDSVLFGHYIDALQALSVMPADGDIEPVLRRFERAFACALGYDFAWDRTAEPARTVRAGEVYGYDPVQGIVLPDHPEARLRSLPGEALLALADDNLTDDLARRTAKRIMRVLMDYLLQGKPLHSRSLFSGSVSPSGRKL